METKWFVKDINGGGLLSDTFEDGYETKEDAMDALCCELITDGLTVQELNEVEYNYIRG